MNEIHGRRVHQQGLGRDIGILGGDGCERAVPKHQRLALGVGFGDARDPLFPVALTRQVKGHAHYAIDAAARKHGRLDGDFLRLVPIEKTADLCVLPFGVFAHHHQVDCFAFAQSERRFDAFVEFRGPDVGELVEGAADGKEEPVERDVVGNAGVPDGAEQDSFRRPQIVRGSLPPPCARCRW